MIAGGLNVNKINCGEQYEGEANNLRCSLQIEREFTEILLLEIHKLKRRLRKVKHHNKKCI
jgi:hypothetical protein